MPTRYHRDCQVWNIEGTQAKLGQVRSRYDAKCSACNGIPARAAFRATAGSSYSCRVWRKAVLTSAIGKVPMVRSIAAALTMARLSVITTEPVRSPDCKPAGEERKEQHEDDVTAPADGLGRRHSHRSCPSRDCPTRR